jgi:hypothetical protein
MSVEHLYDNTAVGDCKWPGQENGYSHFIEVEFFEALGGSTTSYLSVTHDWGGTFNGIVWSQNITNRNNYKIAIGAADFTKFHVYGCLWVPQSGSTPGRLQRYFDDQLVQSLYYLGPPGSPPLPVYSGTTFTPDTIGKADRTYSIIDNHRLSLLLGYGLTWPIYVDWVKVRQ